MADTVYATASNEEILSQYDDTDDFGMLDHYIKPPKKAEEDITKKNNRFWEILNSVVSKKHISDEDIEKSFDSYMAMNMLKVHPQANYQANFLNTARGLKYISKHKTAEYKALRSLITLPKNTRLQGDKVDKHQEIILGVISKHYKVGTLTAKDYFKILGGRRIIALMELYARKGETKLSATDKAAVMKIRTALTAKKRDLLK